jgi:hypothetical protein
MPRNAPSPDTARVYAVIPIAILTIIDDAMAARHREPYSAATPKPFTIAMESCSRPNGIHVHDALET